MITPSVSVVICAFTEDRWDDLGAAVESVGTQSKAVLEIVVVVDHNPSLIQRVRAQLPHVVAVENQQPQGLSGARNTGIAIAKGDVIVFLDDDAMAEQGWLEHLVSGYTDPLVCGVGGAIEASWSNRRPSWFPAEFDWVVGCTYRGMPMRSGQVRNLIGANMSFHRDVFEAIGGFRTDMGRVGARPLGCEETEFCIRARQRWPLRSLLYEPLARVRHRVPARRARWAYFCARCYAEGLSKALVAEFVGAKDGLASERLYTLQVLPRGIVQGMADAITGDLSGVGRAGAIVAGLSMTSAGYVVGKTSKIIVDKKHKTPARFPGKIDAGLTEHIVVLKKNQHFRPIRILEVEIGGPLSAIPASDDETGQPFERAMVLVRLHSMPLGVVRLQLEKGGLDAEKQAQALWLALREEITTHMRLDGLPEPAGLDAEGLQSAATPKCQKEREALLTNAPFVSVVVATHDRPTDLAISLQSLLSLDYPNLEIIVVDNAPSSSATADFMRETYGDQEMIRYVREDQPGLGCAHNRGLEDVRGEIVAFTDDDVVVDRWWLAELVKGFAGAANVGCVTGMIFPRELQTQAQMWIEQHGGFGKGYVRRVFDLAENRPAGHLYPYAAGAFGSGANMAFRTAALCAVGGFDPALGAGSPGVGGDDLAGFFQIIMAGYALVYEPGAIVHHLHRREYAGLRKQVYGYGVGLTAYLTKCLIDRPSLLFDFAVKIPGGLAYALSARSPKNRRKHYDYPRELTMIELKGMLHGPFAYVRGRGQTRHMRKPMRTPVTIRPKPASSTLRGEQREES